MEFPWLASSGLPASARAERRAAMYRTELVERAGLLRRLGYPADRARARLRANLAWDFEIGGGARPLSDRDIDAIVDGVYRR